MDNLNCYFMMQFIMEHGLAVDCSLRIFLSNLGDRNEAAIPSVLARQRM